MLIKTTNDGNVVFRGEHEDFLQINEHDGDVCDMVDEAINNGTSERLFFSGEWKVEAMYS